MTLLQIRIICLDEILRNNILLFIAFVYSRIQRVPDEVITRMSTTLEAPDPFKNSWEKFSFVFKYNEAMNYDFG